MNSELKERANEGLHEYVYGWLQQADRMNGVQSLLDIACGTGAWLQRLKNAGVPQLMGIDLDTRQFGLEGVPAVAVNIDEYEGEPWGTFQMVTALEIIEHLSNPGHLLAIAQQNLAPGGYLVLSTPNIHGLPARLRFLLKGRLNHFDDKSDATHIYPVYEENMQRLAARHGFEIVKRGHFPEKGYKTYSQGIVWAAKILQPFLGDKIPGDNLLYLLQKK